MATALTKTQIDRLGERLKKGEVSDDDLRALDACRRTYAEAYELVVRVLRSDFKLEPTGRPAKSTSSIVEKLRREHIRLTQIQDIAWCRVVVGDIPEQDRLVAELVNAFASVHVVDRREQPSNGYRAVHVIPLMDGRPIEIQVRTMLQQRWAEVSEKHSDVVDPAIKYGGGPADARSLLDEVSMLVAIVEQQERELLAPRDVSVWAAGEGDLRRVQLVETSEQVETNRLVLVQAMERLVRMLETRGKE